MLHEFLTTHRDAILTRTRQNLAARPVPRATEDEIDGIPLFLDQLTENLRSSSGQAVMGETAALHGRRLLDRGFTVAQVVHDYGGVCQSITELAHETNAPITADEFHTFNRCFDDAIAEAVTAFTRQREQALTDEGRLHLGELSHELRNAVGAAMVAFEVIRLGRVGLTGSTADVLSRSLRRISALIDGSLTQVRLESSVPTMERVTMRELIAVSAASAAMEANTRGLTLQVHPGDEGIAVRVDRQLFAAALANLLQNAFKFTAPRSSVSLSVTATADRVLTDVEDECGGLPPGLAAGLFPPFEQRGADRSGLGLGLAITRKSVAANGGELRVRDLPGKGCVFSIDLPRATGT